LASILGEEMIIKERLKLIMKRRTQTVFAEKLLLAVGRI
jgi:hypothetical protein